MNGPITYSEASDGNIAGQMDRYRELADRDLTARSIAALQARGEWTGERARVLPPDKYPPLSAGEHHPSQVDRAVKAGATWEQVAAATGTTENSARSAYREWAEGQHRLHADMGIGLDDDEYAAALELAAADITEAGNG